MSLYYKNNAPSSSSQQPHRALEPAPHRAHEPAPHRALEPIDLANALSYADNHPNWTDVWDPRMSTSFTTTKGLLNGPGENNCFLNSAVQVRLFGPLLWSVWSCIMVCLGLYYGLFGPLLWSVWSCMGSFKCYVMQWGGGGGGVDFPEKKVSQVYVIRITRGWVDVQFAGEKRYVTLEWPPILVCLVLYDCPLVHSVSSPDTMMTHNYTEVVNCCVSWLVDAGW